MVARCIMQKPAKIVYPLFISYMERRAAGMHLQVFCEIKNCCNNIRLISIDRPGFGYSDYGDAEILQRQSELISPLFYKLANGKAAYLVGHSLGGPMIVKLAADNPNLFSSLVILAGSMDPAEEKPEKWRPWLFKTPLNWFVPGALRPSNEELWYLKKDLVNMKEDFKKINCPVYYITWR